MLRFKYIIFAGTTGNSGYQSHDALPTYIWALLGCGALIIILMVILAMGKFFQFRTKINLNHHHHGRIF